MNNQNVVGFFHADDVPTNVGGPFGKFGFLIGCCAETLIFLLFLSSLGRVYIRSPYAGPKKNHIYFIG